MPRRRNMGFQDFCGKAQNMLIQTIQGSDLNTKFGTYYFGALLTAICALDALRTLEHVDDDELRDIKYETDYSQMLVALTDDSYPLENNRKIPESTLTGIASVAAKNDDLSAQIETVLVDMTCLSLNDPNSPELATAVQRLGEIVRSICEYRSSN